MGQATIDRRAAAVATLARIARKEVVVLDTYEAVTLLLYIDHLQGEARHWAEMYNHEALRYASARQQEGDLRQALQREREIVNHLMVNEPHPQILSEWREACDYTDKLICLEAKH